MSVIHEHEVKAALKELLQAVPAETLAKITGCTTDAARFWHSGERCPNATTLVNLAREIHEVRRWLGQVTKPARD